MENSEKQARKPRAEAIEIKSFIDNWLIENPYSGNLENHNAKFKKEFNQFLIDKKFSEETTNLFKIE